MICVVDGVAALQALVPHIKQQQEACQADRERVLPTAFVSFRSRRAQVMQLGL